MSNFSRFHIADYPSRFKIGGTWMDTFKMTSLRAALIDSPSARLAGFATASLGDLGAVLGIEWYIELPSGELLTSGLFELDYNERGYCMLVSWSAKSCYTSRMGLIFKPLMCDPSLIPFIPLRHQWRALDNPNGYSL